MLCNVPQTHEQLVPSLLTATRTVPRKRISIRAASVADSDAIANVCLLSAYQGRSVKTISRHPELPPQVHALPYLHLPSGFAYVLVETIDLASPNFRPGLRKDKVSVFHRGDGMVELRRVIGYVVGTGETTQFNREVEALWLPVLREKYPKDLIGTALDRHFVGLIHKGPKLTSTGSLHIQVDILNKYRGQGYDRLLVDVAMNHLRTLKRRDRLIDH